MEGVGGGRDGKLRRASARAAVGTRTSRVRRRQARLRMAGPMLQRTIFLAAKSQPTRSMHSLKKDAARLKANLFDRLFAAGGRPAGMEGGG
jgi:hypothetical protein